MIGSVLTQNWIIFCTKGHLISSELHTKLSDSVFNHKADRQNYDECDKAMAVRLTGVTLYLRNVPMGRTL